MEWYGPLTILPAVGLLILSTSNFIVNLNSEIHSMAYQNPEKAQYPDGLYSIIEKKMDQLKKLGHAITSLYASVLIFLIAGIEKALINSDKLFFSLMLVGVLLTTLALIYLLIFGYRSIHIRQEHITIMLGQHHLNNIKDL